MLRRLDRTGSGFGHLVCSLALLASLTLACCVSASAQNAPRKAQPQPQATQDPAADTPQSDSLLKDVFKLLGAATDAPPAQPFVVKTRPNEADSNYLPVHVRPPERQAPVLDAKQVASEKSNLEGIAKRNEGLAKADAKRVAAEQKELAAQKKLDEVH